MWVYDPALAVKRVSADLEGDFRVMLDVLDPVGLVPEL